MGSETAWGLGSLIVIVAFVLYCVYQGSRVKHPPQGVPPAVIPPEGPPPV
jgi:hypothetical protein